MPDSSAAASPKARTIVIVHGLWMTGAVFALQRAQLVRRGYRVRTFNYSSLRTSLDEIASQLARFIGALETPGVHLVGHSLGGLVVMHALALFPQLPIGRVVLLGCPLAGSRAVRYLARSATGRILVGRALREWLPERAAPVAAAFEVGMIAGTRRFGAGSLLVPLPTPNDGAVCLDETRLPGLRDHVTMPLTHSGLILSSRAALEIDHFLEHGHFAHV
jgi:pimeloyl-ACP methyl ester carboxylesterase